jgi:hypothetical protein
MLEKNNFQNNCNGNDFDDATFKSISDFMNVSQKNVVLTIKFTDLIDFEFNF